MRRLGRLRGVWGVEIVSDVFDLSNCFPEKSDEERPLPRAYRHRAGRALGRVRAEADLRGRGSEIGGAVGRADQSGKLEKGG